MPDTKISLLPAAAALGGAEAIPGVQAAATVRLTPAQLATYVLGASITLSANGRSLISAADYAAMRTLLGLVISTNVQAFSANLTTYAGIPPSANVQTLLGAATFAAFRTSLGLGTSATVNTGTSGATVPLLDGVNTWANGQTFSSQIIISAGAQLTPNATPATNAMGFLGIPQNIQDVNYTAVMADAGKHLYHTSATPHTWTIPANASVAYPIGTVLTFVNETGAGTITLAITTDTLRWGASTGSRTLAVNGVATAIKTTATIWRLTGDGIT